MLLASAVLLLPMSFLCYRWSYNRNLIVFNSLFVYNKNCVDFDPKIRQPWALSRSELRNFEKLPRSRFEIFVTYAPSVWRK